MRLTKNFTLSEFVRPRVFKHPEFTPKVMSNLKELTADLQVLRDKLGRPIRVTSGFRDSKHNRRAGGVSGSFHLSGKAADIVVSGMVPMEVYEVAKGLRDEKRVKISGFGVYKSFLHLDIGTDYFRLFGDGL